MTIALRHTSGSATEAAIRQHRVTIDRPVEKGGGDTGPMGGELFLASVGGCLMSNLIAAMKARDTVIDGLQREVTAALEGTPARFTGLDLAVGAANVDRDVLEKLVEIAARGCIMINTLQGKLDLTVRIAR